MTPPRKRQDLEAIKLVPEDTFEEAMKAVLRAPREKVNRQMAKDEDADELPESA